MSCKKSKSENGDYAFINRNEDAFYIYKSDMECVSENSENLLAKVLKEDAKKCLSSYPSLLFSVGFDEFFQLQLKGR